MECRPVECDDPYLKIQAKRKAEFNKNLGSNAMKFHKFNTDKERVNRQESHLKSSLDFSALDYSAAVLRPERKYAEINPPLRFTHRGDLERIFD